MREVLKVCKKSSLVSRQVDQTLFYIHEGFFCLCCYPKAVQVSFKFLQCKHMYCNYRFNLCLSEIHRKVLSAVCECKGIKCNALKIVLK